MLPLKGLQSARIHCVTRKQKAGEASAKGVRTKKSFRFYVGKRKRKYRIRTRCEMDKSSGMAMTPERSKFEEKYIRLETSARY